MALVLILSGCDGDDTPIDAGGDAGAGQGAIVRFELPASGSMDWDAVPFPSDLHLDADGRVDLASMPLDTPPWEIARQDLNQRRGFCIDCGGWFAVDGDVDPSSLPAETTIETTPAIEDVAVLMEVDPDTPDAPMVAVDVGWHATHGVVSIQYQESLEPGRRYALALTDALRATDGTPLTASPLFEEVRDSESGGGAEAERARPRYRAALDELEAAGLARERIVGLAVFTTDDMGRHLLALEAVVATAPVPVATVDRVYRRDDGGVDLLMGRTESTDPGAGEPASGTEGSRAHRHETTLAVVLGHFDSPRVVEGAGTDLGLLMRNAEGDPVAGSETESVAFLLAIPDVALDSLDVMVFHTAGVSDLNRSAALIDTAGRHGVAVLAIEAYLHGSRSPGAEDKGFQMRGDDFFPTGESVGDGIFEHGLEVITRLYGVQDVPEDRSASPMYFVSNGTQTIVDALSALRFAHEGDVSAVAAAAPALASLAFGSGDVFFAGWSLGATVGSVVAVADASLAGAILNGAPASIARSACDESELLAPYDGVVFRPLGIIGRRGRQRCFDPLSMFYAWTIEPVDPVAYASMLYRSPIVGGERPDILIQYGGEDDLIPLADTVRYLRAAGVPAIGELGPGLGTPPSTPVSGNVTTPSGSVTASAYLFPGADHRMLVERGHTSDSGVNPIDDVHAQIEHFLSTRLATGRAEIAAP